MIEVHQQKSNQCTCRCERDIVSALLKLAGTGVSMLIKLAVRTALLLSFGFLCACGPKDNKELAANDSYQIELNSPPAKTSMQRHVLGLSVTTSATCITVSKLYNYGVELLPSCVGVPTRESNNYDYLIDLHTGHKKCIYSQI
jgi:hypothetical protein